MNEIQLFMIQLALHNVKNFGGFYRGYGSSDKKYAHRQYLCPCEL